MDRKATIEALRRERQHVQDMYGSAGALRVEHIDAELARFEDRPTVVRRETAVPGSTRRK